MTKKLSVTSIFITIAFFSTILSAGEFFIATTGDDAHPGTREKPFATLEKARDAIREARKPEANKNGNSEEWTVRLSPGTFELTKPFVLETQDSGTVEHPVRYLGVEGETILSGSRKLEGWRKESEEVWVADLPEIDGRKIFFDQLFVGDRRAVRARHPNSGFCTPKEVWQEMPISDKSPYPPKSFSKQAIVANPGDLDLLKGLSKDELRFGQFIVHHHWDTTRRILLGYDADANRLEMQGQPMKYWNPWRAPQFDKDGKQTRPGSLYCIENVRTAFDQPGEWFYDGAAGKVFYRPLPGETLENTAFFVPRNGLNQLLLIHGTSRDVQPVENIRFENIVFEKTDSPRRKDVMKGAALDESITGDLDYPGPGQIDPHQAAFWAAAVVDIYEAKNIAFENCEIRNVGEYAFEMKVCEGCIVRHCALTDLGAGGIRIGGMGVKNIVDNCIIQRGGRLYACAVGVWLGNQTEDNRITHNDIGDFYYTGVSAGWTWGYEGGVAFRNIIEFNRIHDIGQEALADMGGVYTLGTSTGTRVCNNVIFNVKSYGYGGWGLYTDEGSEGILMENNLVYDTTDGSFHQHYGKNNTIRNNILAFSTPHQVAVTRVENHRSMTFENNIIVWDQGKAIGYRAEKVRADYGSNLWWSYAGEVDFVGKKHQDWLDLGKDVGGMVADPQFIDAVKRDFRFKNEEAIQKIGFVPFDFSKAGVYGDKSWIDRAKQGDLPGE